VKGVVADPNGTVKGESIVEMRREFGWFTVPVFSSDIRKSPPSESETAELDAKIVEVNAEDVPSGCDLYSVHWGADDSPAACWVYIAKAKRSSSDPDWIWFQSKPGDPGWTDQAKSKVLIRTPSQLAPPSLEDEIGERIRVFLHEVTFDDRQDVKGYCVRDDYIGAVSADILALVKAHES
jgi:hypothetical protein